MIDHLPVECCNHRWLWHEWPIITKQEVTRIEQIFEVCKCRINAKFQEHFNCRGCKPSP